jgi:hypothetical protein
MTKRCDTCAYWSGPRYPGVEGDKSGGLCRIGPPERDRDTDRGRWPLTLADEYCHAHFPRVAPEAG